MSKDKKDKHTKYMLVQNTKTGQVARTPMKTVHKIQEGKKIAGEDWKVVADPDKKDSKEYKEYLNKANNGG
jgi:hypothetical protein